MGTAVTESSVEVPQKKKIQKKQNPSKHKYQNQNYGLEELNSGSQRAPLRSHSPYTGPGPEHWHNFHLVLEWTEKRGYVHTYKSLKVTIRLEGSNR